MSDVVALIAKYQTWIYGGLGLAAFMYLWRVYEARRRLSQTPFGLERETAYQKQNSALAMLVILLALAGSVYFVTHLIIPNVTLFGSPAKTPSLPFPTATPVSGGQPVAVDSSGCNTDSASLTKPEPNEKITGSFEVRGTANIPDLAFYKLELSGASTNGQWRTVDVGQMNPDDPDAWPVVNGVLGTFDSSLYPSGEYAFRLVVVDAVGNSPPPCVVPVTITNVASP